MATEKTITFCPNCGKPVEASEYFTTNGASDWRAATSIGITIRCAKCNYYGLALRASIKDYEKLMKLDQNVGSKTKDKIQKNKTKSKNDLS